jgi:SMI1 / KNR4 family (SUKH-1)
VATSAYAPRLRTAWGASGEKLRGFEARTGLTLPDEFRDWLGFCNGALVGPGGVYGVDPREGFLDIESRLADFPVWRELGLIPAAGGGTGDYFVVASAASSEPTGIVMFVEPVASFEEPAFAVASDTWHFLQGLFSAEMGEGWWPFDARATLDLDPALATHASVGLPWD